MIEATLVHQRDVGNTRRFKASFVANTFDHSLSLTGDADGVPFESDSGEEAFIRQPAHVCVEDTSYAEGEGATITLTVFSLVDDFVHPFDVHEEVGFAEIAVEALGEVYKAISGSIDVQAIRTSPVFDDDGNQTGTRNIISDAAFDFVGLSVIIFGDAEKDTLRVGGGRLSLDRFPMER